MQGRGNSKFQETWTRLKKNKVAFASLFILLILFLIAVFADLIAPYSYSEQNLTNILQKPSSEHWFGTDQYGRDIFSRVIYGSRISLSVGFVAVGVALLAGGILGAIAGFYGGRVDNVIMRLCDILMCFPTLPLMLGQTVVYLDEQFYRIFGSMAGEGAVSLLNYSKRITQVPIGLMGQAAAVASYPFLVALVTSGERERFDSTLSTALRASVGLIIPAAVWLGLAARPVLTVILQGGRFGAAETLACTPLLQIMLAATPLWIIYMVLVRAFYAGGDTITPAVTGTIMTVLALPCYYFWAVPHGAWAVSAVSSVSVSSLHASSSFRCVASSSSYAWLFSA